MPIISVITNVLLSFSLIVKVISCTRGSLIALVLSVRAVSWWRILVLCVWHFCQFYFDSGSSSHVHEPILSDVKYWEDVHNVALYACLLKITDDLRARNRVYLTAIWELVQSTVFLSDVDTRKVDCFDVNPLNPEGSGVLDVLPPHWELLFEQGARHYRYSIGVGVAVGSHDQEQRLALVFSLPVDLIYHPIILRGRRPESVLHALVNVVVYRSLDKDVKCSV